MVTYPEQTLEGITKFLNTAPLAQERFREIVDQNNELWQGNSSFERYSSVSSKSMGTFKKHLSPDCIRYIESVCYPELKMLGYQLMYCTLGPDEVIIKEFIEPFHVTHRKFDPGYSFHPPRVQQELRRLSYLNKDLSEKQQREWFIFPEVYRRMKENLREKSGPA
jgi:hypothetical protein